MSPHDLRVFELLISILISISITIGVGVYTLRRRRVLAAQTFAVALFLEGAWTIGYFLELVSPNLTGKIFWDNFQWIPTLFLPLALFSFAREYTNQKFKHSFWSWVGFSIVPLLVLLFIFANPVNGLAIYSARLIPGEPFAEYSYKFGPLVWVAIIYDYVFTIIGIATLVKHASKQLGLHRFQTGIIILGFVIPVLGTVIALLDIPFFPHRDLSPYTFSIANLLIAVGLFRFRLFEILPFARDLVMVNMEDGVIILDGQGCLLDINSAAKDLLELKEDQTIGRPLADLIPGLFEQAELDQTALTLRKEYTLDHIGKSKTLDLRLTRLLNSHGDFSGHMLILRDITLLKLQEELLRRDQGLLERHVWERTMELEETNLHLKEEVEQRRQAEHKREIQSRELEILYQLAIELASIPVDADMEAVVTTRLKQLTGAYVVAVSEYNPLKKQLELRRLEVESQALQQARLLLGWSLTDLAVPVSETMYAEMTNTLVGYRQTLTDATFGAIPEAASAAIQKLFKLEMFIGLSTQYQGKLMGSVMLVFQSGQPVPSERLMNALANVISIVYRRKHAEQAHLESESRFHTMADMLPQPIYECDLSGQITYANRKAFEVFGYPQLDRNIKLVNLLEETQRERALGNFQDILTGRDTTHAEYFAQRRDGSTFPILVYSAPIINADRVVGLRGVVVDITERKNMEDALRSSEEKFRSIIEQMSEGIMLVGKDGLVIELNRAFEQIYGMSKTELLGKPFWEMTRRLDYPNGQIIDPAKAAQNDFQSIIHNNFRTDQEVLSEEIEFTTPERRRRVVRRTAFRVLVSQGERMAVVVSDITESKNSEIEQRRLNRTLMMISECNQALVRLDNESNLLQVICNIIVEMGDYCFAWIGTIQNDGDQTPIPIAFCGEVEDFPEFLAAHPESPEAASLRSFFSEEKIYLQPTIIRDIRIDPKYGLMRDEFTRRGFISVLIFPLVFGSERYGTLNIYSSEPNAPDQNELDLFTEMVNDVSFGIHAIRTAIAREHAEQKVYETNLELKQAYESTLEGWSLALELRERETAGHSQRVVALTIAIAQKMGFQEDSLMHIRRGALLHDIGKMGIPDHILLKPEPLSSDEWLIMRQHPQFAYQLLCKIPYLSQSLDIPYSHHERWDGTGYPRQLKTTDIPLTARIFAVVDVWDALTSNRPYRPAWAEDAVYAYLHDQAGQQFDPQVVKIFLDLKQLEGF